MLVLLAVLWQNVLIFVLLSLLSGQMVEMHTPVFVTNWGTSPLLSMLLHVELVIQMSAVVDLDVLQINWRMDNPNDCKWLEIWMDVYAILYWFVVSDATRASAITLSLPGIWTTNSDTWYLWHHVLISQSSVRREKEWVPPCFSMYTRSVMLSVATNNMEQAINVWKCTSARSTTLISKTLICSLWCISDHRPWTVWPFSSAPQPDWEASVNIVNWGGGCVIITPDRTLSSSVHHLRWSLINCGNGINTSKSWDIAFHCDRRNH